MIYISYYTKETPYETVINTHLLPSLKKGNLKYDIQGIQDLGNWNANTAYKAKFIREMLEKHKEDVVFLDADATIEKNPILFEQIPEKYDLAYFQMDWYLHWRNEKGRKKRELLSGTMMFRYNPKVIHLTHIYEQYCKKNPRMWEQKVLQTVLECPNTLKIYNLPATYCAVVNHSNVLPSYIKDPVIVHWQASRKFKK